MRSREIRQCILTDHNILRGMLDELDRMASRILEGRENELPTLRDRGVSLLSKLSEHLAFEERFLGPALRAAGPAGFEQSKHMADDHREQRELLRYILSGLRDRDRPARVVAGELCSFVEVLRDDMALEEMAIIEGVVLRDPDLRPSPRHAQSSISTDG